MPYDQTGNDPGSVRTRLVKMIKGQQNDANENPLKSSSWGSPLQVWNYNPSQDEEEGKNIPSTPGDIKGLQLPDTSTSYEDALKHYDSSRLSMTNPSHFKKIKKLMGPKAKVAFPK